MFGQQNKLKELFSKHGWELIESQVPTDWWIAEIWLIKPTWSPTDCYVFLSYDVDEQLEDKTKRNFAVWSIKLSLKQPDYWHEKMNINTQDEEYLEIPIKRKWEKRIPKIFESLNYLRLKFNNLSS